MKNYKKNGKRKRKKIDLWFDCLRMRRSSVEVGDSQQRSSTATEWRIGDERRMLFSQTTDSMRHNGGRDRKQKKKSFNIL
jgi:hypothetical protein